MVTIQRELIENYNKKEQDEEKELNLDLSHCEGPKNLIKNQKYIKN